MLSENFKEDAKTEQTEVFESLVFEKKQKLSLQNSAVGIYFQEDPSKKLGYYYFLVIESIEKVQGTSIKKDDYNSPSILIRCDRYNIVPTNELMPIGYVSHFSVKCALHERESSFLFFIGMHAKKNSPTSFASKHKIEKTEKSPTLICKAICESKKIVDLEHYLLESIHYYPIVTDIVSSLQKLRTIQEVTKQKNEYKLSVTALQNKNSFSKEEITKLEQLKTNLSKIADELNKLLEEPDDSDICEVSIYKLTIQLEQSDWINAVLSEMEKKFNIVRKKLERMEVKQKNETQQIHNLFAIKKDSESKKFLTESEVIISSMRKMESGKLQHVFMVMQRFEPKHRLIEIKRYDLTESSNKKGLKGEKYAMIHIRSSYTHPANAEKILFSLIGADLKNCICKYVILDESNNEDAKCLNKMEDVIDVDCIFPPLYESLGGDYSTASKGSHNCDSWTNTHLICNVLKQSELLGQRGFLYYMTGLSTPSESLPDSAKIDGGLSDIVSNPRTCSLL